MHHRRPCPDGAGKRVGFDPERGPTLVLNPADDDDFRSFALGLVGDGVLDPSLLQECLRNRYPRAVVRPRELAGELAQIWYVYRDGHWVRPGP
jgi:hypothetical protein